ncbi:hypothetical protein IV37_GL000087 [Fructilactobacillus fructivorans]|uniref:AAA family ATPase n=1 Tax=Fructilactobacillus fructivorans TaxID=1614 RepID=UPI0007049498|nr:AAA family ATPase [Fructilactobacillus fructivorans]KRN13371.1 hypothetical protein IV37_GL000087 [Fructilactobacillus fructivorans]
MRIKKVEVSGFGKLHNLTLDFHEFQVIYGKNEAGKTTLLNFIKDVLFGFRDSRSKRDFTPKDDYKMGGHLIVEQDGTTYIIQRNEGKNGGKLTAFDEDENQLPAGILDRILGPINRDSYDNLFYFGNVSLNDISRLNKEELSKRIQRVGVVGIDSWIDLENENQENGGKIYKPTGKKPELNQLLVERERLNAKVHEASNEYPKYRELAIQAKKDEEKKRQNRIHRNELSQQLSRVDQDLSSWDKYDQLKHLQNDDLDIKQGFAESDFEKFQDIQNKLANIQSEVQDDEQKIDRFKSQHCESNDDLQFYNDNADLIRSLEIELDGQIQQVSRIERLDHDIKSAQVRLSEDEPDAGGRESVPFDDDEIDQINHLMNEYQDVKEQMDYYAHSSSTTSNGDNTLSLVVGATGLVLIGIGIFMGGLAIPILAVIGLLCMGFGLYRYVQKSKQPVENKDEKNNYFQTKLEQIDQMLDQMGEKHHIENFPYNQWNDSLQKAMRRRDSDRDHLRDFVQSQKTMNERVESYLDRWNFAASRTGLSDYDSEMVALNKIKQFLSNIRDQKRKSEQINHELSYLTSNADTHRAQMKDVNGRLNRFLRERDVTNGTEFKKEYDEQRNTTEKSKRKEELEYSLDQALIERLQKYDNIDQLKNVRHDLQEQIDQLDSDFADQSDQVAQLNVQIKNMERDGTLDSLTQELASMDTKVNELVEKWLVYRLTNQWIEKVLDAASSGRIPKVRKDAAKFFKTLTDGHYKKIDYNKKSISVLSDDGIKFKVEELSKGTMQQLYLSLVFALTLAFSDEYPMPIMIDDGFVDFDHFRTDKAIDLMKELAKSTQVVYFTADDRIRSDVNDENLIELK